MPRGTCAVTGAGGYVGSRIARRLAADEWTIRELTRGEAPLLPTAEHVRFRLGDEAREALRGCDVLVHCAWDFEARSWDEIQRTNVLGSQRLLDDAAAMGVRRLVFLSTLSAFSTAQSSYGLAKLAVEKHALALGGAVVRAGLVWSEEPGSLYASLRRLALGAPILPVPSARGRRLYLAHEDDLARLVAELATSDKPFDRPIAAAAEDPLELAEILRRAAAAAGRPVHVIPIPWRVPWAMLRCLEAIGLRPRFRSDSLVSLVSLDQQPLREAARPPFPFRPFDP